MSTALDGAIEQIDEDAEHAKQDVLDAVRDEEHIGGVWMRPPSNDVWSIVIWHTADGWHVPMRGSAPRSRTAPSS